MATHSVLGLVTVRSIRTLLECFLVPNCDRIMLFCQVPLSIYKAMLLHIQFHVSSNGGKIEAIGSMKRRS